MIGRKIAHYSVTEKLGAGGMDEVYRATDTKLGREVALKVLPPVFANDSQRMARFEREAHVLASLNHPNIASIFGRPRRRAATGLCPVRKSARSFSNCCDRWRRQVIVETKPYESASNFDQFECREIAVLCRRVAENFELCVFELTCVGDDLQTLEAQHYRQSRCPERILPSTDPLI